MSRLMYDCRHQITSKITFVERRYESLLYAEVTQYGQKQKCLELTFKTIK